MTLCDGDTGAKWDECPPSPLFPCWPPGLLHPAASCSLLGALFRDASTVLALSHSLIFSIFFLFLMQ